MSEKTVRIGGASASWGDSSVAVPQLVGKGKINYLVFDYLAELTMSILSSARLKNDAHGYALDFIETIKSSLPEITGAGIKVIANAGGVNLGGCVADLEAAAAELGISVKIAAVIGDDIRPMIETLRKEGVREIQSGVSLPAEVLSANAYLGAFPIKQALDEGADIVVTGRCVDSAVTLGVLMHEFGWDENNLDKLAQGSLAGHIIECGCQATGGLFTDWEMVPEWENIGYPIVEAREDGSFTITKSENTGGLVSTAAIAEQILYEIGDPSRYILPDVVCDFTQVRLQQVESDQVEVTGARGKPSTDTYKVSVTYKDGFKSVASLSIIGFDAVAKAHRTATAILARTRAVFKDREYADYRGVNVEVLGSEACFGPHASVEAVKEVVLHIGVSHRDRRALELFSREIAPAATSWAPGTTGFAGRPKISPDIKHYSFLLNKDRVRLSLLQGGVESAILVRYGDNVVEADDLANSLAETSPGPDAVEVPLIKLAHGRSGDKGDICNIGIIARQEAYLPYLRHQLTADNVASYLSHLVKGKVTRFDLPGINAMNFVCEEALDGGVAGSLRNDPWGKGMAQILLSMPVLAPRDLLNQS